MANNYDPRHTGFSWYISDRPGVFNPYNVSDRISRTIWYENIIVPDMKSQKAKGQPIYKVPYESPHSHSGPNALFTSLNCPKCCKR